MTKADRTPLEYARHRLQLATERVARWSRALDALEKRYGKGQPRTKQRLLPEIHRVAGLLFRASADAQLWQEEVDRLEKEEEKVSYVLTAKYDSTQHQVTVDVRLRYRDGQRRTEAQVTAAVRAYSRGHDPADWDLELVRWRWPGPRGGERSNEGGMADLIALQGPLAAGKITIGEEPD